MLARRGEPLEGEEPRAPARSPGMDEARFEATAYRMVAIVGALVTAIGALTVILARWRYANPPDNTLIDLPGTFLVTFGTQLGVTALAFGIPLVLGGAALWLRTRRATAVPVTAAADFPRAVALRRRPRM